MDQKSPVHYSMRVLEIFYFSMVKFPVFSITSGINNSIDLEDDLVAQFNFKCDSTKNRRFS